MGRLRAHRRRRHRQSHGKSAYRLDVCAECRRLRGKDPSGLRSPAYQLRPAGHCRSMDRQQLQHGVCLVQQTARRRSRGSVSFRSRRRRHDPQRRAGLRQQGQDDPDNHGAGTGNPVRGDRQRGARPHRRPRRDRTRLDGDLSDALRARCLQQRAGSEGLHPDLHAADTEQGQFPRHERHPLLGRQQRGNRQGLRPCGVLHGIGRWQRPAVGVCVNGRLRERSCPPIGNAA